MEEVTFSPRGNRNWDMEDFDKAFSKIVEKKLEERTDQELRLQRAYLSWADGADWDVALDIYKNCALSREELIRDIAHYS